jgi:hypothetical protein
MNMLISINTASTKPTERTEDVDKAKDKALTYTEEIVQGIHTIERDIRKLKKLSILIEEVLRL